MNCVRASLVSVKGWRRGAAWLMCGAEEFAIYMNYVRKLGFEETPDYDFLRELFTKVLKTLGEPEDGVFDWMLLNNGKGWEAGHVRIAFAVTAVSTHSVSHRPLLTCLFRPMLPRPHRILRTASTGHADKTGIGAVVKPYRRARRRPHLRWYLRPRPPTSKAAAGAQPRRTLRGAPRVNMRPCSRWRPRVDDRANSTCRVQSGRARH